MKLQELLREYDRLGETADDAELERWLTETCRSFDAAHPGDLAARAVLYNELGSFYRGAGAYAKGEAAYLTAKELLETAIAAESADPVNYATTINNLAGLCRLDKRFDEAIRLFGEALQVYTAAPNVPPQIFASIYNNRGLVYIDMRQYDAALAEFETAGSMLEGVTDADYEIATTAGNMSIALAGLGRLREAYTYMRKAAEIYGALLGDDHPTYQGSLRFAQTLENALRQNGETI